MTHPFSERQIRDTYALARERYALKNLRRGRPQI